MLASSGSASSGYRGLTSSGATSSGSRGLVSSGFASSGSAADGSRRLASQRLVGVLLQRLVGTLLQRLKNLFPLCFLCQMAPAQCFLCQRVPPHLTTPHCVACLTTSVFSAPICAWLSVYLSLYECFCPSCVLPAFLVFSPFFLLSSPRFWSLLVSVGD